MYITCLVKTFVLCYTYISLEESRGRTSRNRFDTWNWIWRKGSLSGSKKGRNFLEKVVCKWHDLCVLRDLVLNFGWLVYAAWPHNYFINTSSAVLEFKSFATVVWMPTNGVKKSETFCLGTPEKLLYLQNESNKQMWPNRWNLYQEQGRLYSFSLFDSTHKNDHTKLKMHWSKRNIIKTRLI